jgi:two-component system cell cycle response regulator
MTARILVVDDILANVRLLEAKLSAEYFEVVTAMNGVDALEAVQRAKPDIVLLDVMMPGIITSRSTMSGLARCTASRASTPFMAVTTSKYSADSLASSKRTFASMSSTTRMRAVILACRGNCQWF